MKLLKLTFGLVLLTCFACQSEDDTLQEIGTEIQEEFQEKGNLPSSSRSITPQFEEPWASWDHEGFETMMEGVGQVVTKAIFFDIKAESQFKYAMLANNNVVSLEDLIGPDVQPRYFAVAFEREYNNFFDATRATPPLCPDGFEPTTFPNGRSLSYEAYLNNLIFDHCLELYMPNNYNRHLDRLNFTSHPLNDTNSNDGYLAFRTINSDTWCIFPRNFTDYDGGFGTFAGPYDNLLIIRPVNPALASFNGTYCDYTVYNGLDFTLFFD